MIPRGTGVDFVRTYGIPTKLDGAVEVALRGRTREIDAGRVGFRAWSGDAAEGWFFNAAGVGMSGAIARRTNESSKALGGKISYLWSTLAVFARWQNAEVRVSVDDEVRDGRDQRGRRRQRPLPRRRDDDLPRGEPRRRPLRRARDRGRSRSATSSRRCRRSTAARTSPTRRPSCCAADGRRRLGRAAARAARRRAARHDARCGSSSCRARCACACRARRRAGLAGSARRRPASGRRLLRCGELGLRLRERVEAPLQLGHPALERVEAPNALGELVHPVAQRVSGFEQPGAAGKVCELLQRLLARLGEPGDHVLLLLALGHRRGE